MLEEQVIQFEGKPYFIHEHETGIIRWPKDPVDRTKQEIVEHFSRFSC